MIDLKSCRHDTRTSEAGLICAAVSREFRFAVQWSLNQARDFRARLMNRGITIWFLTIDTK